MNATRSPLPHAGTLLLALLLMSVTQPKLHAAPPANDTCAGALVLPATGPFPHLTSVVSGIVDATAAGDPPFPSRCLALNGETNLSRSVWFRFTPATTAVYDLSVSADTATTLTDTLLGVYSSPGGCAGPFALVDCNDDEGGRRSRLKVQLAGGIDYFIVVWAYAFSPTNLNAAVQLRLDKPATPANDTCAGAVVVPSNGPFPHSTLVISNIINATVTSDPPFPEDCVFTEPTNLTRSVWFQFTPGASGFYTFDVTTNTATTVQDTVMAIYETANGCSGPLTLLECNDDAGGENRSALAASLSSGTTYYVVVWAFYFPEEEISYDVATALQLRVERPVPPPNDNCVTADIIPSNGPFPHLTTVRDNILATETGDPPSPSCVPDGDGIRSVWYKFKPGRTSLYVISTCENDTRTTVEDTVMAIYSSPSNNCGPFTEVACGDDDCSSRASISSVLDSNLTYFIVVWEFDLGQIVVTTTSVQLKVSDAQPRITSYATQPDGSLQLYFTGAANQPYVVLGSTNLLNWTALETPPSYFGNGLYQFTDTNAISHSRRYYQIRVP